jgi:hypothetical protein
MLVYCSKGEHEYTPGVLAVDTVLDQDVPVHRDLMESFPIRIPADMVDPSDPESPNKQAIASLFVVDHGRLRYKEEYDVLPGKKVLAREVLREQRDRKMDTAVATTTVVGSNGLPIKMDARYKDKSNIEGLIAIMESKSIQHSVIIDADDNSHDLALEQIKTLLVDMLSYGMYLIQEKWEKCAQVEEASTLAELAQITGRPDLFRID